MYFSLPFTIATDEAQPDYVRMQMINGLGQIGGEDVVKLLKELLIFAEDQGLINSIIRSLKKLGVTEAMLENAVEYSKKSAAKKLLRGLTSLRKGMRESEADELVGGAVFSMGANQVHETSFGSFQLLVANGMVFDMVNVQNIIEKIESYLKDE